MFRKKIACELIQISIVILLSLAPQPNLEVIGGAATLKDPDSQY